MKEQDFSPNQQELMLTDIVDGMARDSLKVLSYAYKDIDLSIYADYLTENYEESMEFREAIERKLIYIGTFGLDDPLRDKVTESVELIRYGYIKKQEIRFEQKD